MISMRSRGLTSAAQPTKTAMTARTSRPAFEPGAVMSRQNRSGACEGLNPANHGLAAVAITAPPAAIVTFHDRRSPRKASHTPSTAAPGRPPPTRAASAALVTSSSTIVSTATMTSAMPMRITARRRPRAIPHEATNAANASSGSTSERMRTRSETVSRLWR